MLKPLLLSLCNRVFDGHRNDARSCPNDGGGFGAWRSVLSGKHIS